MESRTTTSFHLPVRPTFAARPTATPLDSVALEEEYVQIARDLDGDAPSHEAGDAYLAGTNALYHGGPIQWSFVPQIVSRRDLGYLAWIAETMGGIMEKVTARFVEDAAFRAHFGLDPRIEAIACMPNAFPVQIPIARVDIFSTRVRALLSSASSTPMAPPACS